jgi:hypothetical protein
MNHVLTLLLFALPGSAWAGNYFASDKVPSEVRAAHDYFLQGDFDRMAVSIKDALMAYPGDAALQADLLDLYDKAYELKGYEAISPDWKAPGAITWLAVNAKKKLYVPSDRVDYRLQLNVEYPEGEDLEQAQIIHYPDEVLIDRQAGIGQLLIEPDKAQTSFWMGADYHRAPNAPGLYLLTLKMKGGDPVHGWFLLGKDANPSGSPEITWPRPDWVFTTPTPNFRWKNFLSNEYHPFEIRRIVASVIRKGEGVLGNSWLVSNNPPFESATIGANVGDVTGSNRLAPDNYYLSVSYRERRRFGDLRVNRDSGTVIPFAVKY